MAGSDPPSALPAIDPTVVDLESDDYDTVHAVFDGLSADSRYRRFQSSRPVLPAATLRRLAGTAPPDRMTHVALVDDRPVGLIHWIRLPGTYRMPVELAAAVGAGQS